MTNDNEPPPPVLCRSDGHLARPPLVSKPRSRFPPYQIAFLPARRFCGFLQPINPAGSPRSAHLILLTFTQLILLASPLPSDLLPPSSVPAKMSTVTRAYLDQRLAAAKRCSRGSQNNMMHGPSVHHAGDALAALFLVHCTSFLYCLC